VPTSAQDALHHFSYGSPDAPDELVRDFLSALEQEEAKLITWGVVDGGFSLEDVAERAGDFLAARGDAEDLEPATLVDTLLRRRLIFDLAIDGRRIYRTRMAESIRLFARLRQLFQSQPWRSGASLVSDFRFALRPRVYPRRNVEVTSAMEAWAAADVLTAARRQILTELLKYPSLAGFQVRATERMLRDIDGSWSRGMIVTVGTGSGKTLAFYLPALTHVATLAKQGEHWTKVIAIYPRNELLKDQFSDSYIEARNLDTLLESQGRRKITIGAFFGPTPNRASVEEVEKKKEWRKITGGYVCPYLRCPTVGCSGALVWRSTDLATGVERLQCSACKTILGDDVVLLTRNRMKQQPPDVLFTTTEMLNRVMGDSYNRHVFGIGAARSPQIVLLDEVHTYTGTHGAQVALLLRRWRHAVRARIQFTGLSATLRNASEFFGQLVGLNVQAVQEITPSTDELQREGMEYVLVLRGDPVSKTSLLSTTIQATMLLRRVLEPNRAAPEDGRSANGEMYGRKVFVFTDDLDVTNRLYHNLLDAEGLNSWGNPKPGREPLAAIRARGRDENPARLAAGQSWHLCEEIGHAEGLTVPLRIGRTSSQDTGVDRESDAIVATASLEVGYNDPDVGAVIQHKAPHDPASFLQRKGRAGRLRTVRPWTVVILSDYGRDRLAYQGYESLFDPAIAPRALPVANRYVLRMQSVFAFMDWLAFQIAETPRGSVYSDLTGPGWNNNVSERQRQEAAVVRRLLAQGDPLQASLARHLAPALHLTAEDVTSLMWEPPRSLMTHVLPTLLRRLESGWRRVPLDESETDRDYIVPMHPLPDFVPANLFSDLSLPEVAVITPAPGMREDTLPIVQALRTLAPGKVTRRFAVGNAYTSHWIAPASLAPGASAQDLEVEAICTEFEEVGIFQVQIDGALAIDVRCVRPWEMRPVVVPRNISVTSNSFLEWRTQLIPSGDPLALDVPGRAEWAQLIDGIQYFGHAFRSRVDARRFALGARANIRWRTGQDLHAQIRFVDRATRQQSSVGFSAAVDGLRFSVLAPSDDVLPADDPNAEKIRAFRTAYFRHRVLTDVELEPYANVFQREWLYQVYASAVAAWAVAESTSLALANDALIPGTVDRAAEKVLDVIFETLDTEDDDEAEDDDAVKGASRNKLREDVLHLFAEPAVIARLQRLARVLWEPPDTAWNEWAHARYLSTLGGALVEACAQLYPEASAEDLLVDVDPGVRPENVPGVPKGHDEIWITEITLGGAGVLEEVARRYAEDPRRFFRLVESALGPSDYQVVDTELTRVLAMVAEDSLLAASLQNVRNATRHEELQATVARLEAELSSRGILVTHTVMSALHARVLRPGSGPHTDALLLNLVQRWRAEEERIGVELDARVFAYLASADEDVIEALRQVDPRVAAARPSRFHALYALLWPRGNSVRSVALDAYNPFASLPPSDRELVLDRLTRTSPTVKAGSEGWRNALADGLREHGTVRLTAPLTGGAALKAALLELAAEPLEIDALHLYPQIEGIERGPVEFRATVYLAEAVQ
jgi:DEAD/DEAH box helicase/Helicase conserved C-terminal domain